MQLLLVGMGSGHLKLGGFCSFDPPLFRDTGGGKKEGEDKKVETKKKQRMRGNVRDIYMKKKGGGRKRNTAHVFFSSTKGKTSCAEAITILLHKVERFDGCETTRKEEGQFL
eukprot:TRINITY_DN2072_c1_g1_i1.p1 TRINITY_DN2072_c1_g1~~TRINITY_DN2072_c1_g1_i1.p1  ORF type:complete len:112 (-),score=1.31 TRINITY_DN2072_c1_g1_i1:342-677(-)